METETCERAAQNKTGPRIKVCPEAEFVELSEINRELIGKCAMGYLDEVLAECGVRLSPDDEARNALVREGPLATRDIARRLADGPRDDNVRGFVRELRSLLADRGRLRAALLPTVLRKEGADDAPPLHQESLVRILLNVDDLRPAVADIVLEEVARCASEDGDNTASLKLCLTALQCVPYAKVAAGIVDVLDVATFENQLEMLNAIPYVVPDSQCDRSASELCRLLGDRPELTPAVVDCLNCLNLSAESKVEVQRSVIERLTDSGTVTNFAVLYEFLTRNGPKRSLGHVLGRCRDSLAEVWLSDGAESEKVIIVNKINTSAFAKGVYEGYVDFLSKTNEHKPIDVLLFVILHSAVYNKKQRIEILFKKQVKGDVLKMNHLKDFCEKYLTEFFVKGYMNSLIDLAASLLKDNETIEFATAMYKFLFEGKNTNDMQRQDIVHNLIALVGLWDTKNVSQILKVLTALSKCAGTMKRYSSQLMLLLDKLDSYELVDVKGVFDILCSLVSADENYSGLKDELHILIRKQLSSSKFPLKQCGVIGALSMAKHLLTVTESQSETFGQSESFSADFSPTVRESVKLLDLVENACEKSPRLTGLFYDQLANVVATEDLDKHFLKWFHEKTTKSFQNRYVVEDVASAQYSLNTSDEMECEIYVDVTGPAVETLAPFFRLLRLLHFKENDGDLSTIDALLGCGVILPKIDNPDDCLAEELGRFADGLYHCANWFREVISAFVVHPPKKIRRKVLQRLRNLVDVQRSLDEIMMRQIPEHALPGGRFNPNESKLKGMKAPKGGQRPKKRQKLDDTALTTNNSGKTAKKTTVKIDYGFRDLDTDVMILLKYPLKLSMGDLEQVSQQTQQTTIDVSSFDFLLRDLAAKLDTLTRNNRDLSLMSIAIVNPINVITDCIRLLPNIYSKFKVISKKINAILEGVEYIYDHQSLFTNDVNELKITFCSVLNCLSLIFAWSGFRNSKNLKLLKDCLKNLRPTAISSQLQSTNQLSREFANEISGYVEQCLTITAGVHLIKIMQALYTINPENVEIKKKVASVSSKLLSRPWYNSKGEPEKGKDHLTQLDILIRSYLDGANVKTLGGLIATLQDQAETLRLKEDHLEMLRSIDRTSFHVLYRNFCVHLLERVKVETDAEPLALWKSTAVGLQGLMAVLKTHESRSNLVHFLRKSVGVLKVFLARGVPVMEAVLRSEADRVVEILKALQTSTRFLHHLCCHSKVTRDSALVAHVPQFRQTLETFVFRVKAMLVANDCSAAFWMGNLRNRDLHGEDVLSQSTVTTGGDDDAGEELPPDESDDDGSVEEGGERSASEVFD